MVSSFVERSFVERLCSDLIAKSRDINGLLYFTLLFAYSETLNDLDKAELFQAQFKSAFTTDDGKHPFMQRIVPSTLT